VNTVIVIAAIVAAFLLPPRIARAMRCDYYARGYSMSRCKRTMLALRNIFSL
jgi:DTW domain-containing protein YfiP